MLHDILNDQRFVYCLVFFKTFEFCSLDDSSDTSEIQEVPQEEVEESDDDDVMEEPPSRKRGIAKLRVCSNFFILCRLNAHSCHSCLCILPVHDWYWKIVVIVLA